MTKVRRTILFHLGLTGNQSVGNLFGCLLYWDTLSNCEPIIVVIMLLLASLPTSATNQRKLSSLIEWTYRRWSLFILHVNSICLLRRLHLNKFASLNAPSNLIYLFALFKLCPLLLRRARTTSQLQFFSRLVSEFFLATSFWF